MIRSTFLPQIFSQICSWLKDFIKIVRLLSANASTNGLSVNMLTDKRSRNEIIIHIMLVNLISSRQCIGNRSLCDRCCCKGRRESGIRQCR